MTILDPVKQTQKPAALVVGSASFAPNEASNLIRAIRLSKRIDAVLAADSHCSAKAVITNPLGEVLILKPSDGDWHDIPGGRIHDGEDQVTGLVREVREETGLSIGDIKLGETVAFKAKTKKGRVPHTTLLYRATALTLDVRLSDEHSEYEWVNPSRLSEYKLGVLAEPINRLLNPSAIQAADQFSFRRELQAQAPESHHETARRAAEGIYQAAIDDWISDLNAEIIHLIFGSRDKDFHGVWVPAFEQAKAQWPATINKAARKAYRTTALTLGHDAGVVLDPSEAELKAFANARGSVLTRFPDSVEEKVRASILRGLENHEDARALGRRIGEALAEIKITTGRRVAATEAQVAYGASQSQALKKAGFRSKRWKTQEDEKVRDSHYLCSSQGSIPIESPFQNGLMFPGDPNGGIEELANCRCWMEGNL